MYNTDLYKRILAEVNNIPIIDCHEHLHHPHELMRLEDIDFGRLFTHYASSDLVSAGMPPADMEQVRSQECDWSVTHKWQAVKPYYEKTWNTAYCECIRIAMQDIYGIDDLRDDTIGPLSEKMKSVPKDTWTRDIFDKANIDIALQHSLSLGPVFPRKRYPELFLYDMVDCFSSLGSFEWCSETGIDVYNLHDYLRVIDWYFDKFAIQASAFKIGRAYDRTLAFEDIATPDASRLFTQWINPETRPARRDIQALEDFIIHYCVRKAGEYDLPVKFHTGLQEGNCNDIKNSRAGLLVNLFAKYPKTRFDIYHISWPYTEELIDICKNFPNVYIDFCWAWIFNPPASRRYLSDMLETIPLNKVHGFGGDFIFVEGSYGHSVIARREISRVLADKVSDGTFTEEYAITAAKRILRENALENFNVEKKRKLCAELAAQE
jgi:hypothetical protein